MKRIALFSLALIALGAFLPGSANAQATRTWVSGVGNDANPCSRTAPCKTWAGAISKTAAGGEIDALDPGGFGAVTITKAITLDGGGGQVASTLAAGTNGIIVAAGVNDVVILRNIRLNGIRQTPTPGLNAVRFLSGAALSVENCDIFDWGTWGIDHEATGTSQLFVINSIFTNNGAGATGGAILVMPPSGATSKASVTGTQMANNAVGFKVSGDNTVNATSATIVDSVSSGSPHSGIVATTGAGAGNGAVNIQVNRVASINNNVGIQASGGAAAVVIGSSVVTGNVTGASAPNGGVLLSYKNNQINGNGADGTPIAMVGLN